MPIEAVDYMAPDREASSSVRASHRLKWQFGHQARGRAMTTNLLSGGQLVVAALRAHRVEMAFSVAGESYLEVLDALFDAPEIRLVTCRQEGGAAFMAEAYGKLTGKPGVLLVTRGPGARNASIGIPTAFQDSTPMVVLVGQVARHQIDREAFQEVDFRKMFTPLAKWVAQIDMAERVPELINQAFQVATSGRPGPVILALPEDMLRDRRAAAMVGPYRPVRGRVLRTTLAIQSGMPEFAAAAADLTPVPATRWSRWRTAARTEYEAGLVPTTFTGALDLGQVMTWLRSRLPDDAIVTSDAGNFSGWPNRFLQYRRPGRQLGPTSGAMGYGVPAAVAAKLVHPDRLVVGFCGDGGFMMTGQELATAMLEGTGPIILVFNNAMYGTIRMHQERRFPGRVVGTALQNPDFLALARAYGAFGASIARTEEFAPAFEEAASRNGPAIIELRMDPETITTRTTLSEIRRQAEVRSAARVEP